MRGVFEGFFVIGLLIELFLWGGRRWDSFRFFWGFKKMTEDDAGKDRPGFWLVQYVQQCLV